MPDALDADKVRAWLTDATAALDTWGDPMAVAGARVVLTTLTRNLATGVFAFDLADTDLPDAHTRAHRNAPETSLAAAQVPPERLRRQQARVLRLFWWTRENGGLTNEEVGVVAASYRWEMAQQTITPRVLELRRYGYLEDSGTRRPTRSGKSAVVWTITPAGRSAAGSLMRQDWE